MYVRDQQHGGHGVEGEALSYIIHGAMSRASVY